MAGDLKRWGEFGHPPKSNIRLGVFLRGIASINPCTPLYLHTPAPNTPARRPPGGHGLHIQFEYGKNSRWCVGFISHPPACVIYQRFGVRLCLLVLVNGPTSIGVFAIIYLAEYLIYRWNNCLRRFTFKISLASCVAKMMLSSEVVEAHCLANRDICYLSNTFMIRVSARIFLENMPLHTISKVACIYCTILLLSIRLQKRL